MNAVFYLVPTRCVTAINLNSSLVTRQVLEKYLLPGFEKEQQSKAKAWFESLK